jgi:MFS family permease
VGVGSTIAFILIERSMGDDALIPMKLFKSQTFSMAIILGVFVGFGMFGAMMTIPLYLQLAQGATPTESGLYMLPMILGMMIASIVSGQVMARTGSYKWFPRTGTFTLLLGYFLMTRLVWDTPLWFVMLGMFFLGLGLGQLMQTLTVASQNSVGHQDMGVATSSATFFRSMGGTAGTAILFSVLFAAIPEALRNAFAQPAISGSVATALADPEITSDPANAAIIAVYQNPAGLSTSLDGDTSFLVGANEALAQPFLIAFTEATVSVYWIGMVVVAIAFVLSWFLKAVPLRQKSAMQEAADDAAALLEADRAAEMMGSLMEPGAAETPEHLAEAVAREKKRESTKSD